IMTSVPPVTSHDPPLSTVSVTSTPVTATPPGLDTLMFPVTFQSESVPASCVTLTVYLNVAVPPAALSISVLSTSFVMPHVNVRLRLGLASFVTINELRSQPSEQLEFVFPKSGALTLSPGLRVHVITPPATVHVPDETFDG